MSEMGCFQNGIRSTRVALDELDWLHVGCVIIFFLLLQSASYFNIVLRMLTFRVSDSLTGCRSRLYWQQVKSQRTKVENARR